MKPAQRIRISMQGGIVPTCVLALFFIGLSGSFVNAEVYARIAPYFGIGRELSTLMNAAAYLAVALVAVRRPSLLDARQIGIVVMSTLFVAGFLLALALEQQSPLFIMVGLLCRAVGTAWAVVMFSVALTAVASLRSVLVVVGGGMVASGLFWQLVPSGLPVVVSCVCIMLCSIVPIALTWRMAVPRFASIRQSATAVNLGFGGLSGYRAVASLVFCAMLFSASSGFALTLNERADAPVATIAEHIALAFVVIVVLVGSLRDDHAGSEDKLFSLAALLIIAGFMVAPLSFGSGGTVENVLLRAGRDCFDLLLWLLFASIGRRNIFALLPLLGSVRCMSALGTDIGAVAGRATNWFVLDDPLIAMSITAAFAFAFVAFLWLGFRGFSFAEAIRGVKPVTEPDILQLGDHIEARCRDLGARCGLTERETEILGLLAKGRDGKFIAQEYVLSYNTVKTHIKHIYAKLDVHSRQELIDLVGTS